MATTKIADIIEPAVYLNYMQKEFPEKNAFIRSGILAPPPAEVQSQMNAGGSVIDMSHWDDLARGFPDIMSDDDASDATPDKITTLGDKAIKHYWHKAWSSMSLSGLVATGSEKDPVRVALARMGAWWMKAEQKALIASTQGVIADNVASDSGDMVYSIYQDIASPTAANRISKAAVTRARLTMGDHLSDLVAVAVHSKVYGDMLDNDDIDFIPDSQQPGEIPTFNGLRVFVDDDMPVSTGFTNTPEYTTYLYGRGAFGYPAAGHDADYALERHRNPEKGNGGGETVLHARRHVLLHPRGVKFTNASVAAKSPVEAELADATNWDRVFERKLIRLAALLTN